MRTDWSHVRLMIAGLALMPLSGMTVRAEKEVIDRDARRGLLGQEVGRALELPV